MVNLINGWRKNAPPMTSLSTYCGPRKTCGDGVGWVGKVGVGGGGHAEGGRHLRSAANLMRYPHKSRRGSSGRRLPAPHAARTWSNIAWRALSANWLPALLTFASRAYSSHCSLTRMMRSHCTRSTGAGFDVTGPDSWKRKYSAAVRGQAAHGSTARPPRNTHHVRNRPGGRASRLGVVNVRGAACSRGTLSSARRGVPGHECCTHAAGQPTRTQRTASQKKPPHQHALTAHRSPCGRCPRAT